MSAPSNTVWGSINYGGSGQGRIGIAVSYTDLNATTVRCTMDVWLWTRYRATDNTNAFDVCLDTDNAEWFTALKNQSIKTTSNSEWSTDNQVWIGYWYIDKVKTTSPQYFNFGVAYYNIEYGGSSGYCYAGYSIPALTSYTVSYNANGGSNAPSSQTKWYGKNLTLSSSVPSRTGYTFKGWGTSSTDTTVDYAKGGVYTNNSSITLYAIWQPHTYAVLFDANGGTDAPAGLTKTYNVALPIPTKIPTRTDYNFLGWSANKTATEPTFVVGDNYTANSGVTLYAVWEIAYIRPRISNFIVSRVDENGVLSDDAEHIKVSFDYTADYDTILHRVYVKEYTESDDSYVGSNQRSTSGTSGHVEYIVTQTDGITPLVLSPEYSYDVKINVSDGYGYSSEVRRINSTFYPIDMTENGENMSFGEPAKDTSLEEGVLRFRYDYVDLAPKQRLLYRGEAFFGQKMVWSGSLVMNAAEKITLPRPISETKNGILLVFSRNGDYNVISYFVPKQTVVSFGGTGWVFPMCTGKFDYIGSKTITIGNTTLTGHQDNTSTATNSVSGITYHNEQFYLRYVYEV